MNIAIVTGSGGLVGSEAAIFLNNKNYKVIGIDNDSRKYFFGKNASTKKRTDFLKKTLKNFASKSIDIRNYRSLEKLFKKYKNKIKNQIFCAGGGTKNIISLANLTKMCENITGNKITIISNKDTSIYDIPYYVSSLKKINKFYKWKPKQKMNKGLIKIFNWMKKNNNQIKYFF